MIDKLKLIVAAILIVAGIAVFYYFSDTSLLLRVGVVLVTVIAAAGIGLTTVPGQDVWQFIKGADMERRKVVWPSIVPDTVQGTLVVIAMVIVIGIYLWLLDSLSFWMIYDLILGVTDT